MTNVPFIHHPYTIIQHSSSYNLELLCSHSNRSKLAIALLPGKRMWSCLLFGMGKSMKMLMQSKRQLMEWVKLSTSNENNRWVVDFLVLRNEEEEEEAKLKIPEQEEREQHLVSWECTRKKLFLVTSAFDKCQIL